MKRTAFRYKVQPSPHLYAHRAAACAATPDAIAIAAHKKITLHTKNYTGGQALDAGLLQGTPAVRQLSDIKSHVAKLLRLSSEFELPVQPLH